MCSRSSRSPAKFRAFGWAVDEVDGHDHCALERRLRAARGCGRRRSSPAPSRATACTALEGQFISHYRCFPAAPARPAVRRLDVGERLKARVRDAFFRALAELRRGRRPRVGADRRPRRRPLRAVRGSAAPGRYLNVGIAEQTLVGVAAGLAYAGKVPFAYSIAPVRHVAATRPGARRRRPAPRRTSSSSASAPECPTGTLAPTHHAIDDLALMRVLPGMTVLAPGDPADAERATHPLPARTRAPSTCGWARTASRRPLPADAAFRDRPGDRCSSGADVTIMPAPARRCARRPRPPTCSPRDGVDDPASAFRHGQAVRRGGRSSRPPPAPVAVVTVEEHSVVAGFGSRRRRGARRGGVGAGPAPRRLPRHLRPRRRLARLSGLTTTASPAPPSQTRPGGLLPEGEAAWPTT